MSEPNDRDISTIRANPNLASHAPIDRRITPKNIDSEEDIRKFTGIIITSLNINLSKDKRDINKWSLLKINAAIAEIEQISIISLSEFISITISSDNIIQWSITSKVIILYKLLSGVV